jgi:hypothetical protein
LMAKRGILSHVIRLGLDSGLFHTREREVKHMMGDRLVGECRW